jgi:phasin family protein
MTGMTRSGMAATADAAVALLSARTLAEAIEINASLARRGVDSMLEGSAKLSEIGTRAAADASRPILSRVSGVWSGLAAG